MGQHSSTPEACSAKARSTCCRDDEPGGSTAAPPAPSGSNWQALRQNCVAVSSGDHIVSMAIKAVGCRWPTRSHARACTQGAGLGTRAVERRWRRESRVRPLTLRAGETASITHSSVEQLTSWLSSRREKAGARVAAATAPSYSDLSTDECSRCAECSGGRGRKLHPLCCAVPPAVHAPAPRHLGCTPCEASPPFLLAFRLAAAHIALCAVFWCCFLRLRLPHLGPR